MKKDGVKEPLKKLANRHYFNKHTVLILEGIILLTSLVLFIVGTHYKSVLLRDLASNILSAMVVATIGTIVYWHTETDVERTVRTVQEETTRRISEIEAYTNETIRQLNSSIQEIQKKSDQLSLSTSNFESMLSLFSGKACTFCKNYIKDIKFSRDECDLQGFFSKARKSICILVTNLESFSDFAPILSNKAQCGVEVKIATLHPNDAKSFNLARLIDSTSPEKRWEEMKNSILQFATYRHSKNFHLCTYSGITPTLILIMVDNECYVAYLINGMRSRETIHFLYSGGDNPGEHTPLYYFKKHFEIVWMNSNTKESDWTEINALQYSEEN